MSLCVTIPYFGVDYRGNELVISDLTLVAKLKYSIQFGIWGKKEGA